LTFAVSEEDAGVRLDRFLATRAGELSRTRIQELIAEGCVSVNGVLTKPSHRVEAGEQVEVEVPQPDGPGVAPEAIPLDVLYEDDELIAINKPAGMTVHAGAGVASGTLVNALLGRGQALSQGGDPLRPGIVHRLDKETSGIVLVAKNDSAHATLSEAFRQRTIRKIYLALVQGKMKEDRGRIELAIARDPNRRARMTARRASQLPNARAARTDWRLLHIIGPTSLLEVLLHTGRTHQIRVHFSALHHPVVGDTLYGAAGQLHIGRTTLPLLGRNFLHAAKISFAQPRTGQTIHLTAPLPIELREFLAKLAASSVEDPARIDAALKGFL
jgi:23S rRNA pseudouridine1911/1915/1917 synthase